MDRQQRLNRKFNYIQNLYNIAFEDISDELITQSQAYLNFELVDDIESLIKIDQEIHQLKKRIKQVYNTNEDLLDEARDLFLRLTLVHKAIRETMRVEFGIIDCRENEQGRLEYVKC